MKSDHSSLASDIGSVQHGGPDVHKDGQRRDGLIPPDNNHRILSSLWPHLPQTPPRVYLAIRFFVSFCNEPEIDFSETRWESVKVSLEDNSTLQGEMWDPFHRAVTPHTCCVESKCKAILLLAMRVHSAFMSVPNTVFICPQFGRKI